MPPSASSVGSIHKTHLTHKIDRPVSVRFTARWKSIKTNLRQVVLERTKCLIFSGAVAGLLSLRIDVIDGRIGTDVLAHPQGAAVNLVVVGQGQAQPQTNYKGCPPHTLSDFRKQARKSSRTAALGKCYVMLDCSAANLILNSLEKTWTKRRFMFLNLI